MLIIDQEKKFCYGEHVDVFKIDIASACVLTLSEIMVTKQRVNLHDIYTVKGELAPADFPCGFYI